MPFATPEQWQRQLAKQTMEEQRRADEEWQLKIREPSPFAVLDVLENVGGADVPEAVIAQQLGRELEDTRRALQRAVNLDWLTVEAADEAIREHNEGVGPVDGRYTITDAGRERREPDPGSEPSAGDPTPL